MSRTLDVFRLRNHLLACGTPSRWSRPSTTEGCGMWPSVEHAQCESATLTRILHSRRAMSTPTGMVPLAIQDRVHELPNMCAPLDDCGLHRCRFCGAPRSRGAISRDGCLERPGPDGGFAAASLVRAAAKRNQSGRWRKIVEEGYPGNEVEIR